MLDPQLALFAGQFPDALMRKLTYLNKVKLFRAVLDLKTVTLVEDTTRVATWTGLVAGANVHLDLMLLMLATVLSILQNPPIIGERDEFPSLVGWEIPPHPDALQYLKEAAGFLINI
jgi:hypothetical protein